MSQVQYQADLNSLMGVIKAEQYNSYAFDQVICKGMNEDSRVISSDELFIARPGLESDGRRYINQAITRGANAVVVEAHDIEHFVQANTDSVPVFKVENLAHELGNLASSFYRHPTKELTVVGVTGTNGKTSCTQMIAHVLETLEHPVGVMGTLGVGRYGELEVTNNTTLDALSIHKTMAHFRDQGMRYVVMEVSSHALVQGRVNGIDFDLAMFTNLSRDHLDYHGNMKAYAEAKKRLFRWPDLKYAVVNSDDTIGLEILSELAPEVAHYSYSITAINAQKPQTSIYTESVTFSDLGVEADVMTPWGEEQLNTRLIGQFNLSNCLGVLASLGALGFSLQQIAEAIQTLKPVAGRMECFGGNSSPLVVVDYAHTPDALKHALAALRPHTQHRLWCIVGCGGDRDRGKRPMMAAIAEEYADYVVMTADNPRGEDIMAIIHEMREGLRTPADAIIEPDRKRAIENTINGAVIGDVILVAGKGHEDYQQIGREKLPHSDVESVQQVLQRGNWS